MCQNDARSSLLREFNVVNLRAGTKNCYFSAIFGILPSSRSADLLIPSVVYGRHSSRESKRLQVANKRPASGSLVFLESTIAVELGIESLFDRDSDLLGHHGRLMENVREVGKCELEGVFALGEIKGYLSLPFSIVEAFSLDRRNR